MSDPHELNTTRLLLRQWRPSDLPAFAALNADQEVMRYFPSALDEAESDAIARRLRALIEAKGWGFWAAEEKSSREFIGFIGLHSPDAPLPFAPCVEVGWRLARRWWGKGLASEGAAAALDFAFGWLDLDEVVSFTAIPNHRSEAVMKRLGMHKDMGTFEHPSIPEGHWLREHCLYRAHNPARRSVDPSTSQ